MFWWPISPTWTPRGSGAHLAAILSPFSLSFLLPFSSLLSPPPAAAGHPCTLPLASRGATPLPPAGAGYAAPSLLPPRTTWRAAAMELGLTGDGEGGGWVAKGRLGSFSEVWRIMCARRPPGTRAAGGRQCGRRLIHGGRGGWMAGYMYISFFW